MPRLASVILGDLEQRASRVRLDVLAASTALITGDALPPSREPDRLAAELVAVLDAVPDIWADDVWWETQIAQASAAARIRCLEQSLGLCAAALLLTGRLGPERAAELRDILAVQKLMLPVAREHVA